MKVHSSYIFFLSVIMVPIQAESCCGDPYIIQQSNMPYTIKQEGLYCLAESVTGSITVNADQVVLDLAGRSIAQSSTNINVTGHSDIIIRNGSIENASTTGLAVNGATNIMLQDLDFIGNNTGVLVETSTGVTVDRCTFRDHAALALNMQNINVGHITNCLLQQNHGTSVILLNNGTYITCENVEVVDNSCTINDYSAGIMALFLNDSNFVNCKIIGNTAAATIYQYGALTLGACNDIQVYNCIASNNESNSLCAGFLVGNSFSSDFPRRITIDSCVANGNNSTATEGMTQLVVGIFLFGGDNMSVTNCIAEDNHAMGQSLGIANLGVTNVIIKNNRAVNNIGDLNSYGILLNTSGVAWANEVKGHTQNFYGAMPKVTYDTTNGIFKIFGTNTPTTPTCYDNISIE